MGLFSNFGNAAGGLVSGVGSAIGLPEYGISETMGYGNYFDEVKAANSPLAAPKINDWAYQAPVGTLPSGSSRTSAAGSGRTYGASTRTAGPTAAQLAAQRAAAEQAARVSQAQSLLQGQLGRLPGQLDTAFDNIQDQYGVANNQRQSNFNQAQNTYNQQGTQNRQNLVTDRNNINDQASQGLRGLMRMLGAFGAGGSSDRFLAGDAVTSTANQQLSGAGQAFSGNQSSLDTNWGNFKSQDENERERLGDWRTQQRKSAQSQNLQNRTDILSRLADLQTNAGAAQGFIDQIGGLQSKIDGLGRFNPTFDGRTPVYQAPTLDNYDVGQTAVQGGPQSGGNTPFLSLLLNQDDERRRF